MLQGDGEGVGLDEVVQLIATNELEGELTVFREAGAERLYFHQGRVVFASERGSEEEAEQAAWAERFTDLVSSRRAPFRFRPGLRIAPIDPQHALDATALLMESARLRDEGTRRTPRPRALHSITGARPGRRCAPSPTLEGELRGVGLPALLQALHERRRTGTLWIFRCEDQERARLHLFEGAVYARPRRHPRDAAEARRLLGIPTASLLRLSAEVLDPAAAEEAAQAELRGRLLEATLWEGARFAFIHGVVPRGLEGPTPDRAYTRLCLKRLLLEAAQLATEWDALRVTLGPLDSVFCFLTETLKDEVVRTHPLPEVTMLIDGRRPFAELARRARVPAIEAARVVANLLREGYLLLAQVNAPPPESTPERYLPWRLPPEADCARHGGNRSAPAEDSAPLRA